jgi:hypothetical protein
VSNGYVFLTGSAGNVAVYDLNRSREPVYVDSFQSPEHGNGIALANNYAYVASGEAGLRIIDVTKPDIVAPVITPIGDLIISIDPGSDFIDPGFSAIDGVDGDISNQRTISTNLDVTTVGEYYYTISVTDRAGNTATKTWAIIVAAKVSSLSAPKGAATITVGKRKLTIRPFGKTYRGRVFARTMIVKKVKEPVYVFVPLDPLPNPQIVEVNNAGRVVKRVSLKSLSRLGLNADATADGISAFLAVSPLKKGKVAKAYKITATAPIPVTTATAGKIKGVVLVRFLKLYSTTGKSYGLVTALRGKNSSLLVWRYAKEKNRFLRDTGYAIASIVLRGSTISLKKDTALVP